MRQIRGRTQEAFDDAMRKAGVAAIKYVIAYEPVLRSPALKQSKALRLLAGKQRMWLFENRFFRPFVQVYRDDESPTPAIVEKQQLTGRDARVRLLREDPTKIAVTVNADVPALLVVSESWHPGWEVTVDGTRSGMKKAEGAFQAVSVPKGRHEVVFEYSRPEYYRYGAFVSLASAIITVLLLTFGGRRPQQVEKTEPASTAEHKLFSGLGLIQTDENGTPKDEGPSEDRRES